MMKKRIIITVFAVIVTASMLVGAVYAVLSAKSNTVTNELTADTDPVITVAETFENNVKTNVKIDVGDPGYTVYVRAKVIVTWKDDDGNVYSKIPTSADYSIVYNTVTTPDAANQWFKGPDNIYYYTSPLTGETGTLITSCEPIGTAPEGYHLSVEVITQVVQALGTTDTDDIPAVVDAWEVKLTKNDDGVYLITGVNSAAASTAAWEVGEIAE